MCTDYKLSVSAVIGEMSACHTGMKIVRTVMSACPTGMKMVRTGMSARHTGMKMVRTGNYMYGNRRG